MSETGLTKIKKFIISGRMITRYFANYKARYSSRILKIRGWYDEFGVWHEKRDYAKITKHCSGWKQ